MVSMKTRTRMRWMLVLTCLAAAWLWLRAAAPVTRVRELPANVRFSETLIDGWVYGPRSSGANGGALAIGAFQLDAPRQREVLSARVGAASVSMLPVINRGGIFYVLEEPLPAAPDEERGAAIAPTARVWSRRPRVRLWRASLDGEAPRELLPEIRTSAVRFGERHVYWLRHPLTGPGVPIVSSREASPAAELMVSGLEGGPARKLANVQVDSQFAACADGVHWSVRRGSETKQVHLRMEDGAVEELPAASMPSPLLELEGRWFWLETGSAASPDRRRLVMASAGSPRRALIDVEERFALEALTTDGKDVYCFLLERPARSASAGRMRRTFCRLRIEAPSSLERIAPLPQETPDSGSIVGGWFHRGHYYFASYEKQENWLIWWGDGLKPRQYWVLNRVRLPN